MEQEQTQELTFEQAFTRWSPTGQEAFRRSISTFSLFGWVAPRGIAASFPAQYMALCVNQEGQR